LRYWLYIAILLLSHYDFAQVISNNGRFSVNFDKGCALFTVEVTDLTNTIATPQYIYDGADITAPETLDTFFTYTAPGSYIIIQINNSLNPTTDTLEIEVIENEFPEFEYFYCDESAVFIEITDTYYDFFQLSSPNENILIRDNRSLELNLPPGVQSSVTVQGFFEDTAPNCGQTTINITPRELQPDIVIENLNFDYLCDNELRLIVDVSADPQTFYEISYSSGPLQGVLYEGQIDSSTLIIEPVIIDTANLEICLDASVVSPCSGTRLPSSSYCDELPATFTAIEYAFASYNSQNIDVIFENSEAGIVSIEKIIEGEVFQTWDSVSQNLTDVSISPLRRYNYNLIYTPFCGASEQSLNVSPPFLYSEELETNQYEFNYEPSISFLESAYETEVLIFNSQDTSTRQTIEAPTFPLTINLNSDIGRNQIIQVVEIYNQNNFRLFSNPIQLDFEEVVFIPKAFTPNDDGLNDVLEIFGLPTDNFELQIFNTWGELIYVCSDIDNFWNGRTKNQRSPEGVYVYKIVFETTEGNKVSQSGSFLLLNN